jgi:thiol-disulfide isomerase/thioredoxin
MKNLIKHFLLLVLLVSGRGCSNQTAWELAPGIYILDKNTPVKTYADLADRLPRKAIYVDRWATWCAPCLEEFKYYDELRPFLEEHDIEILYLNSEMGIEDSTWFNFIKKHELLGYHVRFNFDLQRDLIDQEIFTPMIPQFMIIDSTGKVLEKGAKRPSDGEALKDQLTELLDLT